MKYIVDRALGRTCYAKIIYFEKHNTNPTKYQLRYAFFVAVMAIVSYFIWSIFPFFRPLSLCLLLEHNLEIIEATSPLVDTTP